MSRALVTGATGMLGSHIASRLVAEGVSVRGVVRKASASDALRRLGIEPCEGDLLDGGSIERAARDCSVVFHAAAAIGSESDAREFERTNVAGTTHVIHAASRAGARLVHVSSTAVFGASRYHERLTDEDHPLPVLPGSDAYGRSKQAAEQEVLAAAGAGRVWATIVRPPIMYGRGDRQFVPRVAPVLSRGVFPLIGGGRATLPLVHAGAVAEGALGAARFAGASGRVYHLTSDFPVSVRDLIRYAGAGLGRRIFMPRLPVVAGRAGFLLFAAALRAVGRSDLARHVPGTFRMLTRDNPFSSERARRELGWQPRLRPEEGLPDAFRWWREQNEAILDGGGR